MNRLVALATATASVATGSPVAAAAAPECHSEFEDFVTKFSKTYESPREHSYRRQVFCKNMVEIQRLQQASPSAQFGPTRDSDLTPEEFASRRRSIPRLTQGPWCGPGQDSNNRRNPKQQQQEGAEGEETQGEYPDAVDWRQHTPNPVSAVNNQGGCNGCYAFSAVETIESAAALLTNTTAVPLSVQQALSCSVNNTLGCESGFTECVYGDLEVRGGLELESDFPFTCVDYPTHPKSVPKCVEKKKVVKVTGWHYVLPSCYDTSEHCGKTYNSSALLRAIATHGPVSTCLDNSDWQHYKGGVLKNCGNGGPGHCVQIVGYNTTADEPYVLIRNSYSEEFGEDGYIRVALSDTNECGLADVLTIPHVQVLEDE